MGKLRIVVRVAVTCSVWGPSSSLLAQDAQNGPTESDLKAAYCLSVVQDEDAKFQACQRTAQNQAPVEFWGKICHDNQDRIARLNDYLAARGYMYGEKDPTPVVVAGDRGHIDVKDCMRAGMPVVAACRKKCDTQKDIVACMKACPLPESCRRLWSCNDLSFLPF
jgi:hypothetical protein